MPTLSSGDLAKAAGVNPQTLRYYERRGLLPAPSRNASNYRVYGPNDVDRVVFVKRAQAIGFSLDDIAGLLELRADPEADCNQVRTIARDHLSAVEARIADLEAMRDSLRGLIDGCPGVGSLEDCPIVGAFVR